MMIFKEKAEEFSIHRHIHLSPELRNTPTPKVRGTVTAGQMEDRSL